MIPTLIFFYLIFFLFFFLNNQISVTTSQLLVTYRLIDTNCKIVVKESNNNPQYLSHLL